MISVDSTIQIDVDKTILHFEPMIKRTVSMIVGASPEADDCKQLLRMKIWALFENKERTFNEGYIARRLTWDTINFINRDAGYNWDKIFLSLEQLVEASNADDGISIAEAISSLENDSDEEENKVSLDFIADIGVMITRCRDKFTPKQYEALMLFLSGAPSDVVQEYYGSRHRNMTRYFNLVDSAVDVIREEIGYHGPKLSVKD